MDVLKYKLKFRLWILEFYTTSENQTTWLFKHTLRFDWLFYGSIEGNDVQNLIEANCVLVSLLSMKKFS